LEQKTVLVVEDNALNMKLVRQLITIAKYKVLEASNAEDGIKLARTHRPDLIMIDIQLPGMDGLTAAKIMKDDPASRDIPVVALTAHAMQGDEIKAKAAGCDDYLSKPIDTKVFFKTLEKFLVVRGEDSSADDDEVVAINPEKGAPTILVVDDEALNVKLLSARLGTFGYHIMKAYSGFEALEIVEARGPDLILLDIMMPGMDGYEVLGKLKENDRTKFIPVVLITALDGKDEKTRGLEAGADEFLNKPVNATELETRVRSLLRMKKYKEQLTVRIEAEDNFGSSEKNHATDERGEHLPTVLVVEDDPKDADIIAGHLDEMPLNMMMAGTGSEAIKILEEEKIDLVILDLLLPDRDGIDICRWIKENDSRATMQVVIVTTLDDLKVKIRGIEEGADDYFVKPFNPQEIKARVTALLKKKSFMDRLSARASNAMKAAITDRLTGVYNHAFFKHALDLEVKRSLRHNDEMALLIVDIDDFKKINDTFGHPAGDRALATFGEILKAAVRDVDIVARYGGDEFVAILPYSGRQAALRVAERLQSMLRSRTVELAGLERPECGITASIGIAVFPENGLNADTLKDVADSALYHAKKQGKNKTCFPASTIGADSVFETE
jgi:two-component system cell cycle response regulator